jgi:hypothetical protein
MLAVLSAWVDPRPLAICRILVGLAAAGFAFEWIGVLVRAASGNYLALPAVEGLLTVSPQFVIGLFVTALIAALAMVLGVAGRLAPILVAATTGTVLLADQQTYSNHLVLLFVLSLFLGFSGGDQAWALSRSPKSSWVPYWPAFLVKAQVSSVYAWTAIAKINPEYLGGEVLDTYLHPWVPIPQELLPVVAVMSIVAEGSLAVLLWIPQVRKLTIALGAGLHVGIVLLLQDPAPLIGFAMLMATGYVLAAMPAWKVTGSGYAANRGFP